MATFTNDMDDEKVKENKFDLTEFLKGLDKNYQFEIHKLKGFVFNESQKNINHNHYVICIHNFLSPQESALYQKHTRKVCEKDLIKHGNRRHALYFNVDDKLNKQIYRYGKHDWKMNNGIPDIIQTKLLTKVYTQFGISFNGIVYNVYTSKKSHIWWHTDLQPGIGDIVCTFSTGRTEYLEFRPMHKAVIRGKEEKNNENMRKENDCVLSVPCYHGTFVIMSAGVNAFYQHRVSAPTQQQLEQAIEEYGCIDRESTTMHFHFDETKYTKYLNMESNGGLSSILKHLNLNTED